MERSCDDCKKLEDRLGKLERIVEQLMAGLFDIAKCIDEIDLSIGKKEDSESESDVEDDKPPKKVCLFVDDKVVEGVSLEEVQKKAGMVDRLSESDFDRSCYDEGFGREDILI